MAMVFWYGLMNRVIAYSCGPTLSTRLSLSLSAFCIQLLHAKQRLQHSQLAQSLSLKALIHGAAVFASGAAAHPA